MRRAPAAAGGLLLALCACSGSANGPQQVADHTTTAIYNDDYAAVTARFDPALKSSVTREQVGMLSDRLHRLGRYQGLSLMDDDVALNEYTYKAAFTNGTAKVVERLDGNGSLAAFRLLVPR